LIVNVAVEFGFEMVPDTARLTPLVPKKADVEPGSAVAAPSTELRSTASPAKPDLMKPVTVGLAPLPRTNTSPLGAVAAFIAVTVEEPPMNAMALKSMSSEDST